MNTIRRGRRRQKPEKARTSRLTLVSSISTWSKQLMGARKMIAFISSKNGTQAAVQIFRSLNKPRTHASTGDVPRYYHAHDGQRSRGQKMRVALEEDAKRHTYQRPLSAHVVHTPVMAQSIPCARTARWKIVYQSIHPCNYEMRSNGPAFIVNRYSVTPSVFNRARKMSSKIISNKAKKKRITDTCNQHTMTWAAKRTTHRPSGGSSAA